MQDHRWTWLGTRVERGYEACRQAGDRLTLAYGYVSPEVVGRFTEAGRMTRPAARASAGGGS